MPEAMRTQPALHPALNHHGGGDATTAAGEPTPCCCATCDARNERGGIALVSGLDEQFVRLSQLATHMLHLLCRECTALQRAQVGGNSQFSITQFELSRRRRTSAAGYSANVP